MVNVSGTQLVIYVNKYVHGQISLKNSMWIVRQTLSFSHSIVQFAKIINNKQRNSIKKKHTELKMEYSENVMINTVNTIQNSEKN